MTFLRFGSDIYKWMNINNVRPFAPIRYCNYWRLRVSIKLVIQEIESMNNSWMRDLDTCIIHLCNGLRTKSCISEYWTKGNIIGWPNICRPNWPKIFPFVQYSLFFNIHLYMIWHLVSFLKLGHVHGFVVFKNELNKSGCLWNSHDFLCSIPVVFIWCKS